MTKGIILIILGVLVIPIIIGIPLFVWGIVEVCKSSKNDVALNSVNYHICKCDRNNENTKQAQISELVEQKDEINW